MHNDQEKEFWDSDESIVRYGKIEYYLMDAEKIFIMEAITQLGKPISEIKILDLGCGGGRTNIPLHKMGAKVRGLDISKRLIDLLKKNFPEIDCYVGDAMNLSEESDKSYDIVLFSHNSIDCLVPLEAREKCLAEISRVLSTGGFFIFSSHIFNFIPYNLSVLRNIVRNVGKFSEIIFKGEGYYIEQMENGEKVQFYYSRAENTSKSLSKFNLNVLRYTRLIGVNNSLITSFIRALLSWEQYYLARKI
jgi:ubiquinone/menaquinone biosynthesis C-methylase UbiE